MAEKQIPVRAGIKSRRIKVDNLTRVEGEGSLLIDVQGGELRELKLKIFEPPRFFEALLKGRALGEAPDITARICGICPVAYMMSAVHAMERALGVTVSDPIRQLRRLLYCGEWIESHVLHIFMLHAPDFLGYDDVIGMARDHGERVKSALAMKKAGNEIIRVLGGREVHPINVKVGGFYKLPEKAALTALLDPLKRGRDTARDTVLWASSLDFPELTRQYEFVALQHPDEYPMNDGRIVSSRGLDIQQTEFPDHFEEIHLPHSNALHAVRKEHRSAYFVGPMARYQLSRDQLSEETRALAKEAGFLRDVNNPFESIVVRALETHYAFDEAIRLIEQYEVDGASSVPAPARKARGVAATEAPRGLLFHQYDVDERGLITRANIVPPTSQNQFTIEEDLHDLVSANLELPQDLLTARCEQAIRNYDPCISCATHFLKLDIRRD